MYSASELVVSGLGVSVLAFVVPAISDIRVGWVVGRATFLSVGMYMLFLAWLQFINFDGSWPWNQAVIMNYVPTEFERARVRAISRSVEITQENVDDERRCLQFNVCVRQFARR